jgi:hypothetical protein
MIETILHVMPIDQTLAMIEEMYVPPTARRWRFWKLDRVGIISFIADRDRMITYGSDAYELATRTGIMVEYHSMGGVNIPAISIPESQVYAIAQTLRNQGAQVEFVY